MSTLTTKSDLHTPREAAVFLRTNDRTLERWRTTGTGPAFVKLGGRVFYRLSVLEAFVEQSTRQCTRQLSDV